MNAPPLHIPGPGADDEPPSALLAVLDRLSDPLLHSAGLTTTSDGRWALLVTVSSRTPVPLARLERQAEGWPVVYERVPDPMPVARPAYPARGE